MKDLTDIFAIQFYEWMDDNYIRISDGWVKSRNIDESKRTIVTINIALEIFKKEMYKEDEIEYCNKYKWGDCECEGTCRRGLTRE